VFADDQPMGESNRSAPRLALKLQLLAADLRTVMTAMGHPTNLPVLKVLVAYRCVIPFPLMLECDSKSLRLSMGFQYSLARVFDSTRG